MSDPESRTFESSIAELEALVQRLERNDGTLDESIETYRRASDLATSCRSQLESARLRITELMPAPEFDDQDETISDDEETDDVPF